MDPERKQDKTHTGYVGQGGALPSRVILGVSGSVSAYKSPLIVRELVRRGVEVKIVMTPSAERFVSALTLQNVSRHPVVVNMFDTATQSDGSWHVALAHWGEAMLIAPASASTLAALASGNCDTALTLVAMSLPPGTPLYLAPAMDGDMWEHPATCRNVHQLKEDGAHILDPEHGELASGLFATGRLPDPERVVDFLRRSQDLAGKRILVTAGPTREKVDDVRYLSNHSSGKMGFAIAREAARRGAQVLLVSGPVTLPNPAGVETIRVESAQQMYETVLARRDSIEIFVMAAAVADFRPAAPQSGKMKKEALGDSVQISLERTPDILREVGQNKRGGQFVVGFALEAADILENARRKLVGKNCDLLVLNAANRPDSGFAGDRNTITVLDRKDGVRDYPPASKEQCAAAIWDEVSLQLAHQQNA